MTTANHLINALAAQNKDKANSAFDAMIQDRLADQMEVRKVELASTIMDDLQEAKHKHTHQVVYTVPGEGKQKQYFHVTADDEDHAREQLKDAEPNAKIHKVERINEATGAQRQYTRQVRKAVAVGTHASGKSKSMHTDELKAHVRKRFKQLGGDEVARHASVVKGALDYRKLHGEETIVEGEHTTAKELVMYADNDAQLYRSSHQPIVANLKKKVKKGVYDHAKATKLWRYHADRAAQSYAKEHGDGKTPWHKMFSTSDRNKAAQWFANGNKEEIHEAVEPGAAPSTATLNRNILGNIRAATQALRLKVNPNQVASGHRKFAKLSAANPKAPGYALMNKLAPAEKTGIQALTQAGVPLGQSLEASPVDFKRVLQQIKRFK